MDTRYTTKLHMGREQGHRPLPLGPGNRKVNEVHIGKSTYSKELVQSVYSCTTKVHIGKVVHTSQKVRIGRFDEKMALYKPLFFPDSGYQYHSPGTPTFPKQGIHRITSSNPDDDTSPFFDQTSELTYKAILII